MLSNGKSKTKPQNKTEHPKQKHTANESQAVVEIEHDCAKGYYG